MIQNYDNNSAIAAKFQQYQQQQQQFSDSSSDFKTPLQRLHLRMKDTISEGEQHNIEESDNSHTSHSSNKINDLTNEEKDNYIRYQMLESQRRHIQKNQDQIIQQLYAFQRNSVLNAQYQQQQQKNLNRSSLTNAGDKCKEGVSNHNGKDIEGNQLNSQEGLQTGCEQNQTSSYISQQSSSGCSSYLYSCQDDYDQQYIGNQKSKNLSSTTDPWWKQSNPSGGAGNLFANMNSMQTSNHHRNSNSNQIYPIALRLFCEKYNRDCVFKFVDDDEDNKEFRKIPGNNAMNADTQFACQIILDGVKFGVMRGRSKKEAKNQAAKKAVQRLMELGVDKQQRMFFEKYLQSVNDTNQQFTSMIMQSQLSHQEQMQLLQQQNGQMQNEDGQELNCNYTQELSLFAHKTLRKPVSWETIFQIYSKTWLAIVYVGNLTETGCGSSKKSAKNNAALKLLKRCKQLNMKEEIIQCVPKANDITKNNLTQQIQGENQKGTNPNSFNSKMQQMRRDNTVIPKTPCTSSSLSQIMAAKNIHNMNGFNMQYKISSMQQNFNADVKTSSIYNNANEMNKYLTNSFHNSSSNQRYSSIQGNLSNNEFIQARNDSNDYSSYQNNNSSNMNNWQYQTIGGNVKSNFKGVNNSNNNNTNNSNMSLSNQRNNINDKTALNGQDDCNNSDSRNILISQNNNYKTTNSTNYSDKSKTTASMMVSQNEDSNHDKENQNISNMLDIIAKHKKAFMKIPQKADENNQKEVEQEIVREQPKKENDPRRKLQALQLQQKLLQEQKEQELQQQQQQICKKSNKEEEDKQSGMNSEQKQERQLQSLFKALEDVTNKKRKIEECNWSGDEDGEEEEEEVDEFETIMKKNKQNEYE